MISLIPLISHLPFCRSESSYIDLLPVFRTSPSMISDERKGKRVCRRAGTQKRR